MACNSSPKVGDANGQCCNKFANKTACKTTSNKSDTTSYDFDENFKACQTSSCAVSNYKEADIVPMAQAKVGDITQCPVSGAFFKVKEESPAFTYNDKTFHTCCSSCGKRFQEAPTRFAKNVVLNSMKQQRG